MGATHSDVRQGRGREGTGEECVAVNEVVTLLRDKWTLLVMGALRRGGPLRYNELQRAVGGISQRMLTLTAKTLEANGLVTRTVHPAVPPRVEYELTPMGRTLIQPMQALLEWSMANREAMAEAREAYAKRSA